MLRSGDQKIVNESLKEARRNFVLASMNVKVAGESRTEALTLKNHAEARVIRLERLQRGF